MSLSHDVRVASIYVRKGAFDKVDRSVFARLASNFEKDEGCSYGPAGEAIIALAVDCQDAVDAHNVRAYMRKAFLGEYDQEFLDSELSK
jgi:hypothetical protein